jgi:hypothetical protein
VKRRDFLTLPFHPMAFGIFPVVALLAHNLGEAAFSDALRPLAITFVLAVVCLVVFRPLFRDWPTAAAMATATMLLFHGYGHVYRAAEGASLGAILIGRHRYLLPLFGVIWAAVGLWLRRHPVRVPLTQGLNLAGVLVLLFPLVQITVYQARAAVQGTQHETWVQQGLIPLASSAAERPPDIYYIVLDEYARQDVLDQIYGLDNSEFIDFLTGRGFRVLSRARANYDQTELSLSSTLNLDYLQAIDPGLSPSASDRSPLTNMIQSNVVRQSLERAGYSVAAFSTGFGWSEWTDARWYLAPPQTLRDWIAYGGVSNPFEGMVVENSLAVVAQEGLRALDLDLDFPYRVHRSTILFALDQLTRDVPRLPGPKFVFAHIIAPHGPVVFGPNGEDVENPDPVLGYAGEVTYLNRRLEAMVDGILRSSETPPVIILQADTGPGYDLRWENPPGAETLWARMTILNAIYMPGGDAGLLRDDMSSVNTFRVVFRRYFGAPLEALPDHSYYSVWDRPYDFRDVTSLVETYREPLPAASGPG